MLAKADSAGGWMNQRRPNYSCTQLPMVSSYDGWVDEECRDDQATMIRLASQQMITDVG
jgi:hypothetical protein